ERVLLHRVDRLQLLEGVPLSLLRALEELRLQVDDVGVHALDARPARELRVEAGRDLQEDPRVLVALRDPNGDGRCGGEGRSALDRDEKAGEERVADGGWTHLFLPCVIERIGLLKVSRPTVPGRPSSRG